MSNFKRDSYVKIVDTHGNYRFGYIAGTAEHGFILEIDLSEEGLSKINWDKEFAENVPDNQYTQNQLVGDFNNLLTETEKKMVPLLAQRWATRDIADSLEISPVTVRAHIRDLKNKLQVDTREQLFALAQGIEKKLT